MNILCVPPPHINTAPTLFTTGSNSYIGDFVMLLGQVNYKMGQKHRLAIPKLFRQNLGQNIIMSRGYEGCLIIVSQADWQIITQPISQASFLDQNARSSARYLLGGAHQIELDSQGRCIVPASLVEHAQLVEEVVFVGLGQWVEVWDKSVWQQQQVQLQSQGSAIAQALLDSGSGRQDSIE